MSGVVVWITGLPSSGKSTLAERALRVLHARGAMACMLDGDAVRACLVPPPGYSASERAAFYASLANLAALLARQGFVVLVPATAHRRAFREQARSVAPAFIEVFVATSLSECEERDDKGLYAKARAGELRGVPGLDEPFEEPATPDVVVRGDDDEAAVQALCARALRAGDSAPRS
ncbi:MAG TPA: adenylyl-sulfate kinase [Polyangiaceae bacterium]|nr:adenylyl-sulfate kinase [Polyangiaceae bacterium]